MIITGTVEITLKDAPVNQLSANDIFGELALVDLSPRSATVTALTDCQLISLSREKFIEIVKEDPEFALYVMSVVAERLRRMTERSIREKIKQVDEKLLDTLFDL